MTEIADLIARVEGATEGSRELDCLIWLAVVQPEGTGALGLTLAEAMERYPDQLDQVANVWRGTLPAVSTCVTAALGLAERVLPEWCPAIRQDPRPAFEGLRHAFVMRKPDGRTQCATWGSTPALALVLAILRAKEEEE